LEEEAYEGEMFLSYFKKGIEYVPGGVDSGTSTLKAKVFEPRLLKITGQRYPRVFTVDKVANSVN